jgi:hypothetical protein
MPMEEECVVVEWKLYIYTQDSNKIEGYIFQAMESNGHISQLTS